jgi:sulfate adenylyltransferase subunit 1 (EFTu-like GTPase family)/uncharacterized membrane protein
MPVQYVNRPSAQFRGYCGVIATGEIHPGEPVCALPSGRCTRVARIVTADGELPRAAAGQAVTLTLADEIDVSRGDVLTAAGTPVAVTSRLGARLVATGTDALASGRSYLLKLGTVTVKGKLQRGLQVIDLETHRCRAAQQLAPNEIGTAVVMLDRPIAVDRYADCRETGSFILIDPESCDTVGMGIVETIEPAQSRGLPRQGAKLSTLVHAAETHGRSIAKTISWRAAGSLDTFILAVVITGSSTLAGGVALAEVLTKTALYYLHERVWALIPWGRR